MFVLLTCLYLESLFDCDWSWLLGRAAFLKTALASDLPEIFRVTVVQGAAVEQLNNSLRNLGWKLEGFCLASASPFHISTGWSVALCNQYHGLDESHAFTVFCVYYFSKCTLWEEVQQNTRFSMWAWAFWLPALQLLIVQEAAEILALSCSCAAAQLELQCT